MCSCQQSQYRLGASMFTLPIGGMQPDPRVAALTSLLTRLTALTQIVQLLLSAIGGQGLGGFPNPSGLGVGGVPTPGSLGMQPPTLIDLYNNGLTSTPVLGSPGGLSPQQDSSGWSAQAPPSTPPFIAPFIPFFNQLSDAPASQGGPGDLLGATLAQFGVRS